MKTIAINTQLLETKFQRQTGCTPAKAQKATERYLAACLNQIVKHEHKSDGLEYYISTHELHHSLHYVQVQGTRHYVWDTFQSFDERVFTIIEVGSNLTEKLTMSRFNYKLQEIIEKVGTAEEIFESRYLPQYEQQIAREEYDMVPIDQRSLGAYITSSTHTLSVMTEQDPYYKKVNKNLDKALVIQKLSGLFGDQLLQVHSPSQFGRRYYQGPNLQTVAKEVRHAALGNCHEYDIESSALAWKLGVFEGICEEMSETVPRPATLELLDHKQAIRRQLAQQVFPEYDQAWAVKIIKQAITALGFGAPLRSRGYQVNGRYQAPALSSIITDNARLDRFLASEWIREFVQEQKQMNDAIIQYCRMQGQDEVWKKNPDLTDSAGRLRPNSVIAFLYQTAERQLLEVIMQECANNQVLLTVHDCIYTRRPIRLQELRAAILEHGRYFKIEHQVHRSYTWEEPVAETDPFRDPRESAWTERVKRLPRSRTLGDLQTYDSHCAVPDYDPELDPYLA